MTLSEKHIRWLENRGIGAETAVSAGLYTDRGNVLVFPFFDGGKVVNRKYRGPEKKFWQDTGGKKTFWNADVMDDPALESGSQALVIAEGEIDAMTAIECGWPMAVSVPDGAPPPAGEDREEGEALKDDSGKFAFMWNNRDRLKRIKRFIIAVDSDEPGIQLAKELVSRLKAARCMFVTYPEDCKDLNDVLMKHGKDAVHAVLRDAKPYPVTGVYEFKDAPEVPPYKSLKTGWPTLDRHFGLFPEAFTVVTGIPQHGKSTWMLNLCVNMARLHGWRTAVFSPEIGSQLKNKLRRIVSDLPLYRLKQEPSLLADVDDFINEAFVVMGVKDVDDDDMTFKWLTDSMHTAFHRYGARHFLIDPFNMIEHMRPPQESLTDYVGWCLKEFNRFAKRYGVAVTVVAHPTKAVGGETTRIPNLYDIEGSANWFNKPDFGIVVARDFETGLTTIRVAKVRFEETGMMGDVLMRFDQDSSTYQMLDPDYIPDTD